MDAHNLKPGHEQKEVFYSHIARKRLIQYDYRHINGDLFSCIAKDSMDAHDKRARWAKEHGYKVTG